MKVIVVPPDPTWPAAFEREAGRIAAALGDNVVVIHHIGSTAIRGIHAKPVIDLLPVVRDLAVVDERAAAMAALGYEVMGELGIPGRRYFRKELPGGIRTHNVHAFQAGSPQVDRHLAFRDYMNAHADDALAYSYLKRRLALAHPDDIEGYMAGKDAFIKEIDRKAAVWRALQSGR